MVNLGLICHDAFGVVYVDALRKYQVRGFTYLPWSTQVGKTPETPYRSRNLADALSVFIDTANVSSVKSSHRGILVRFGVMDIEWSLGGRLDRTSR